MPPNQMIGDIFFSGLSVCFSVHLYELFFESCTIREHQHLPACDFDHVTPDNPAVGM